MKRKFLKMLLISVGIFLLLPVMAQGEELSFDGGGNYKISGEVFVNNIRYTGVELELWKEEGLNIYCKEMALTGEEGSFSFTGLSNGRYRLKVPERMYGDVCSLEKEMLVSIENENVDSIQVFLGQPGLNGAKVAFGAVEYSNQDSRNPMGIKLFEVPIRIMKGAVEVERVTTNEYGQFSTNGTSEGDYEFVVDKGYYGGRYFEEWRQTISITENFQWIDIELQQCNAPGTSKVFGVVKGKSYGFKREPLKYVPVKIFSGRTEIFSTKTDFNGNYSIYSIPPGNYTISVEYSEYGAYYKSTSDLYLNGEDSVNKHLNLDRVNTPMPPNLIETKMKGDQVELLWTTDSKTDSYDVYQNGEKINSEPIYEGAYKVGGLSPQEIYSFSVKGKNLAGESRMSNIIEVETGSDINNILLSQESEHYFTEIMGKFEPLEVTIKNNGTREIRDIHIRLSNGDGEAFAIEDFQTERNLLPMETTSFMIEPKPWLKAGEHLAEITVEEGGGFSKSFVVRVTGKESILELEDFGEERILLGEDYVKSLRVTYTGNDQVFFSSSNLPEGLKLDELTGIVSGSPRVDPGIYRIEFKATDNRMMDMKTLWLRIEEPEEPPFFITPNFAYVLCGVNNRLLTTAISKYPVCYQIENSPEGVDIDPLTGEINVTEGVEPGTYHLLITAKNEGGNYLVTTQEFLLMLF
ncbi:MAG: putative Ig domain-containing protein [Eubacteriaceae bacterium]